MSWHAVTRSAAAQEAILLREKHHDMPRRDMPWRVRIDARARSIAALAGVAALSLAASGCGGDGLSSMNSGNLLVPTPVATSLRFTSLAVGLHHACGLTANGALYCWGDNSYSQLGSSQSLPNCQALDGPCSSTPLLVAGGHSFQSVAASLRDTCAIDQSGATWCWGFGLGGQLGNGASLDSATPVPVSAPVPFSQIALGGSGLLSCALGSAGSGYCWGPDGGGGLGNGTTAGADTPTAVAGGLAFESISVGDDHACALTASGEGYCWGDNEYGDLGLGLAGEASEPAPIAGGLLFTALSAGLAHTCGLTAAGSAYCWGFIPAIGTMVAANTIQNVPIAVSGGIQFTHVSAGENDSCGLDASGAAWCWGQNAGGSLGDGSTTDRIEPVPVHTDARFVGIWAGGSTCALDANGQAWCWGPNGAGQDGQPL
jgi:alpha-tubulin suppressor-like RCC1 family protein